MTESPELRTYAETEYYRKLIENGAVTSPFFGVKGSSVLSKLFEFNYIDRTACEYMHCILLGVVRNYLSNILLTSDFGRSMCINSRREIEAFDSVFSSIKPPSSFRRFRGFKEIKH